MRLPLIKHISKFIEKNDEDFVKETIEVLEDLTEFDGLKDEELDTLGELISNMYGAIEVEKLALDGLSKKDAMNSFMKRVQSSIDR